MSWIVPYITFILSGTVILASCLVILQQRRTPQSAFAWLLVIVFLPYLGIPLFLALGFRKDRGKYKNIDFISDNETEQAGQEISSVDQLLRGYGLPAATPGHDFQLLTSGESAHAAFFSEIEGAQKTIDATFYRIDDDDIGRSFVEALIKRQESGVQVRLILDWLGSTRRPRKALKRLSHAGGEVHLFAPFLHSSLRGHVNLRNHRKMVIVDGRRAVSGGMNVAENYMGPVPLAGRWIDLAYVVEGPVVQTFQRVFLADWHMYREIGPIKMEAYEAVCSTGTSTVQLAVSGPDLEGDPLHAALLQAIYLATTDVWIVTPYFLPTPELMAALIAAAHRSVAVHIIVPEHSNQKSTDLARGGYLRDLADVGCKISFYPQTMVHAKAWVTDDYGFVGSANFDIRSLLLNFETMLILQSPQDVSALKSWAKALENNATAQPKPTGRIRRSIEGVFRLGSPFL
jgi:cardiolipin synthase